MLPLKPPVAKKKWKTDIKLINFPLFDENGELLDTNSLPFYHGIFNGKVIIINDSREKSRLSNFGSFGQFGFFDKETFIDYRTLQNQVLKQKKNWQEMELKPFKFPDNTVDELTEKETSLTKNDQYVPVGTLKRSDNEYNLNNITFIQSEVPNYINIDKENPRNWKELKQKYSTKYNELLILSGNENDVQYFLLLEEAFFLCYTLECLEIQTENGLPINTSECWEQFNGLKENFPFFYVAYHYYRSKGWAVKPGQQYGGDFVLYKSSPVYYHSSYVVVVSVNGQNSKLLSSWTSWFGCCRSVEAASKDILLCTVHGPIYKKEMPIDLTLYTVNDTIVRRWVPSQNRVQPQ